MRLALRFSMPALLALAVGCSGVDGGGSDGYQQGPTGESGAGGAVEPVGSGAGGTDSPAGTTDAGAAPGPDSAPSAGQGCAADTQYIYVVSPDKRLYRFDPSVSSPSAFKPLGTIGCGTASAGPNSMTVGRDGYAYVLYGEDDYMSVDGWSCGGIYKVSIDNASCVGTTPFQCGSSGFKKFGMGFASDAANSTTEGLYVCDNLDTPRLGRLDLITGQVSSAGPLPGLAEFTGNGKGELWGFFPEESPPVIAQVDKANGSLLQKISLAQLPSFGSSGAFAFAYWGGSFYIFYVVDSADTSTNVWKLDTDGTLTKYISNTGLRIVGAGVSTCAPIEPPK